MLIWILAFVLFGSLGFVGWSLGVIRVGISFIGLLIASLLAWPMGHFVNPILSACGLKNPVMLWFLGPFVVFVIISIAFKVIGMIVHKKIDVYYKYKAGDLKMGLWNRLSARLGLCVGLANAALYLVLISTVIYVFSYATTQMVTSDTASWSLKLLNTAGKHVADSGMNKIAAAIDPVPETYYQASDLLGLIYHNDLLESRLSRYPAFLAMGERAEFQDIAKDKEFTEMRQRQAPIADIMNHAKAQTILSNPVLLKEIWGIVAPNIKDLQGFLTTGKSVKYDEEPILGRWNFSISRAIFAFKQGKPNVGSQEMLKIRRSMELMFSKTTLVAAPAPEKQAFLKNIGKIKPPTKPTALPTAVDLQTLTGKWSGEAGKYEFSLDGRNHKLEGTVEEDKLTITGEAFTMIFEREY